MKNSFDFTKVHNFDDHIRRSIPMVEEMYRLCHEVTYAFAQEGTAVVDLGCSTGKFLIDATKRLGVEYVGLDRAVWKREVASQTTFLTLDIVAAARDGMLNNTSVILSLFTLQFLPYNARVEVIERAAEGLVSGGAMIIAEKTHLADAGLAEVIERDLIEWKRSNFDDKEVLNKSAQLRGSMRRMSQYDLAKVMRNNFDTVSTIWAHGQFTCKVGVKA
jgi:tRNA (cmo5U34)-methyltransferase